MKTNVSAAFDFDVKLLPLDHLLPTKAIKESDKRYQTILVSLRTEGLLEPLMVYPAKGMKGRFLIVDGHYRHRALKELKQGKVKCLMSHDDESLTYNFRINRLAPIQENGMLTKAIKDGVKPERLAAALNIPLERIMAQLTLLDGLDKGAVDLLKDKPITYDALRLFKKVTPLRQQELAEILISSNTYSRKYVQALLAATNSRDFIDGNKSLKIKGVKAEDIARMEKETESVEKEFKLVKEEYGNHLMDLTIFRGYLKRLLTNIRVEKFLSKHYPELLTTFRDLVASKTI